MAAPPQAPPTDDGAQDDVVLSDVHVGTCPPGSGPWVTRFSFREPATADHTPSATAGTNVRASPSSHQVQSSSDTVDEDGDLVLSRPRRGCQYLQIRHALATPISSCGEQVWLGSLLLADYLLSHPDLLEGRTVLELGTGVGLAGLIAARKAKHVLLTDADESALVLAAANVYSNIAAIRSAVSLRRLNWFDFLGVAAAEQTEVELLQQLQGGVLDTGAADKSSEQPNSTARLDSISNATLDSSSHTVYNSSLPGSAATAAGADPSSFAWRAEDLDTLASVDLLLAADVVYDLTLTEALMHTARCLMARAERRPCQCATSLQPDSRGRQPAASAAATPSCGVMNAASVPAVGPAAGSGAASAAASNTACSCCASRQRRSVRMLVALERRYTFTLRDMDSRAPAFEHFLTFVSEEGEPRGKITSSSSIKQGTEGVGTGDCRTSSGQGIDSARMFAATRLLVQQVPQLLQYDRSPELELWELWLPA